jgi:hypothetical protein
MPTNLCPLPVNPKWTLCCRGSGRKCPSISVQEDRLQIKDDDGSTVSMTLDQFDDVASTLFEVLRFRSKAGG